MYPDSPAYNIPSVFRLSGKLNSYILKQSINEIICSHEIFRTTFSMQEGELVQVAKSNMHIHLTVNDLTAEMVSDMDRAVQSIIEDEIIRPFDMYTGPLYRFKLLHLSDDHYIFIIVMHHIITDLYTTNQFTHELAGRYKNHIADNQINFIAPLRKYSDFAIWQKEWMKEEDYIAMLTYWRQQLKERNKLLNLGADRTRFAVQSLNGKEQPINFSESLSNKIKSFSTMESITPFVTLLSAYVVLLSRYSGQLNINVGVPFTNRRQEEFKNVMGCFVNILPVNVDLSNNPSFRDVVSRVKKEMLGVHRHQEIGIELIVDEMRIKRDASYNPFYQVGFTCNPPVELELNGLKVESLYFHNEGSKLDMFFSFWESDERIHAQVEYNTDLLDHTAIAYFVDSYKTLLEEAIAMPDNAIFSITLLSEYEKRKILVEWNATESNYHGAAVISELFNCQARRTPDAIALVFEKQMITYRQLNSRANQLANYLQAIGIGSDDLVGVCMNRSVEMMVGLLGILKAGAAYVPLDPAYPRERLEFIAKDARLEVLLTRSELKTEINSLELSNTKVVYLDLEWDKISAKSEDNPNRLINDESLAYVIYTSGSTGKPKGVAMSHLSLLNLISWQLQSASFPKCYRTLQYASLCFDVSFQEIFSTWCSGGTLFLIAEEERRDPVSLLQFIVEKNIERLFLPFVSLHQIVEAAKILNLNPVSLNEVITAGEQLQVTQHIREFFMALKNCTLQNQYGPTESHVVTAFSLTGTPKDWSVLPPIGRPIANTRIYILDRYMQPVPVGVSGEIYIGGKGVARGYLNRPELTAERFIADPFSNDPNERLYKTGDSARYLPDGNIEYLGRLDNQVKIRGFRIEPGEIESVLSGHHQVREAVVAAKKDVSGNPGLVGYIVPVEGETPAVESLRGFLQQKLPDYMVPGLYVMLSALPLTPSGKVDRKALPEPEQMRPEMNQGYVAPTNSDENAMSEIWCRILGLDKAGIHDNFFDLGGNSLLSIQLVEQTQQAFDADISIIRLFQYPTISSFTKLLKENSGIQRNYHNAQGRANAGRKAIIQGRVRKLENKKSRVVST